MCPGAVNDPHCYRPLPIFTPFEYVLASLGEWPFFPLGATQLNLQQFVALGTHSEPGWTIELRAEGQAKNDDEIERERGRWDRECAVVMRKPGENKEKRVEFQKLL